MTYELQPRRSRVKWLLLGALLGAGIYWGPGLVAGGGAPAAGGMGAMGGAAPVNVAEVIRKPVTQWHEFSGMLEAVNAVEVRPRIGGQITGIHFADGAEVKKGQPLFTIDPRPYEASLISARGALTQADASFARAKKLVGSKAISRAEFDAAQSAQQQALGAYKTAELNLAYTHISAPISGKISRAEITLGNLVDAGGQAPLLASIVDLSPIYASVAMDEQSFLKTIRGVPQAKLKTVPVEVRIGNDAAGEWLAATVHSFDNQIAPGSGTLRVRARLANADGALVPGLYARVRIGGAEAAEALLAHPTAIGTDQSKKFVLVVDGENKAQYREVTLGALTDGLQVIASGLAAGDKLVVGGLQRVRPGAPVTPEMVDMATLTPLAAPAEQAQGAPAEAAQ